MKIGILSLALNTNYGGILQSYAIQTVLERMGHEVIVLDKDNTFHRSLVRKILSFSRFFVKTKILRQKAAFVTDYEYNKSKNEREQFTQAFINRYIHTRKVKRITCDTLMDVDAIVVGSDQVWRPRYFKKLWETEIENAFLKFAEKRNIRRIAYAASFGTDEWEYTDRETNECSRLLKTFNVVSVREDSAVEFCKNKLGRSDVIQALDPTLLLSKKDYIQLVESSEVPISPGNLMCYVLDRTDETQKLIDKIAKERGLKPFYANSKISNLSSPQSERIQPPLEGWLRGFMEAEFVVTDSYHACIFSIIFGKPFVVVGNKKRGMARFKTLLSLFSSENHLISLSEEYHSTWSYSVDKDAMKKLEKYREDSLSFLDESLN